MFKKIFFLILISLAVISYGCNVYDEIIDAAIVDQAGENSDSTTTTTSASSSNSIVSSGSSSIVTFPITTSPSELELP